MILIALTVIKHRIYSYCLISFFERVHKMMSLSLFYRRESRGSAGLDKELDQGVKVSRVVKPVLKLIPIILILCSTASTIPCC